MGGRLASRGFSVLTKGTPELLCRDEDQRGDVEEQEGTDLLGGRGRRCVSCVYRLYCGRFNEREPNGGVCVCACVVVTSLPRRLGGGTSSSGSFSLQHRSNRHTTEWKEAAWWPHRLLSSFSSRSF